MVTGANRSTRWGQLIIDALVAAGVELAIVAPGSRSTPLVVAATAHPQIETESLLDERGAAFAALGHAKRTGDPAAVICTSGTAGGNMLPAVIEAHADPTPLVVCTADRPPSLHGTGANQTIEQAGLFAPYVRDRGTTPMPVADAAVVAATATAVAELVAAARGPIAGPVHLNVPLAKPLAPTEPDASSQAQRAAIAHPTGGERPRPADAAVDRSALGRVAAMLRGRRTLIVAGPMAPWQPRRAAIARLARRCGAPLLADPLSGLRCGPHVTETAVIAAYDAVCAAGVAPRPPDVVLRFGATPTSAPLQRYLGGLSVPQVMITASTIGNDPHRVTTDQIVGPPGAVAAALCEQLPPTEPYASAWAEPAAVAAARLREAPVGGAGVVIQQVDAALQADAALVIGSSMPVRELDRYGGVHPRTRVTVGNRGASGIDGLVSTAVGVARSQPTTLVLGDVSLIHDLGGLIGIDRVGVDLTVVCLNDDGGGIFEMLPIAEVDPPYTEYFRTPHGLTFDAAAQQFGLSYERVPPAEFASVFAPPTVGMGGRLVEVPLRAADTHAERDAAEAAIAASLG
ncbi:MAG: 2-succinyl-5-enolpyruvyl-6-hydroxy-3-cyclohexene-1-carboxylic-acid synthase [Haloquadratum sp.]|nr:2-succinyl-5-enolpyruvyl-6-hydroxy-3-cyclohexene-1-carboxylic-acid synthase [Haloferacaceae archaeon]MDR9444823.1 2-succinyl-5-enolpyruvyl-6-hydroxy-3-cyclohexene-1-carboxylic-acid synthase [Haloquadratum sp.]